MSLKGSLQTVALPEVLRFLSGTGKSGEFHVSGSNGEGRLWYTDGRISGFRAERAAEAHEAIFQMLRITDGDFDFSADREPPEGAEAVESVDLDSAIEAAEARLAEWLRIVEVVPSLAHRLRLRAEAPGECVELAATQWAMVVAISQGGTVGEVIAGQGQQEFDGCAAVRDLVEAGLVEVSEPVEVEAAVAQPVADALVGDPDFSIGSTFRFEAPVEAAGSDAEGQEVHEDTVGSGHLPPFGYEADVPVTEGDEPTVTGEAVIEQPAPVTGAAGSEDGGVEAGPLSEDHYAALRAAMVEVGENLSIDGGVEVAEAEAGEHPVYEMSADPELDGRAALHALLTEVTAPEDAVGPVDEPVDEPVDGLADRGPWTDHELSSMDADGPGDDSNIVPFAPVQGSSGPDEADEDEDAEAAPSEEPINRGLLLKFLSSVRN
ncbi:MAG: DUF4388 domain-containing protein [Actinomycetota bacterium]|nr:DUF4388 domain-containing protein [Actinomycetota bacterium]